MPINAHSTTFTFSLHQQTDAVTTILDANVNKLLSVRDQRVTSPRYENRVSDLGWFGKGFPDPTFSDPVQKWYELPSAGQSASDLSMLWGLSQCLGAIAVVQPDPVGLPATWEHTVTWQTLITAPEVIYGTALEELGTGAAPGWSKTLEGLAIDQVTLEGDMADHVVMNIQGRARDYVINSTINPPASLTAQSFFKTQRATITYGPVSSPVSVSAKIMSWSLTVNRNTSMKWRAGQPVGEELLMARMDVGQPETSASITIETEDIFHDHFLDDDLVELNITLTSEDQVDSVDKSMVITLPRMKLQASEPGNLEDFTLVMPQTFAPGEVLRPAGGEPVTFVLTTDIDNTEVLVDGS